jgi:hypothetical protein
MLNSCFDVSACIWKLTPVCTDRCSNTLGAAHGGFALPWVGFSSFIETVLCCRYGTINPSSSCGFLVPLSVHTASADQQS